MNDLLALLTNMFPTINFENNNKLIENRLIDSLGMFRLINALEQEYRIKIPIEEITLENFNSINTMHSLIVKLTKS